LIISPTPIANGPFFQEWFSQKKGGFRNGPFIKGRFLISVENVLDFRTMDILFSGSRRKDGLSVVAAVFFLTCCVLRAIRSGLNTTLWAT
jgi:hypothetical protein